MAKKAKTEQEGAELRGFSVTSPLMIDGETVGVGAEVWLNEREHAPLHALGAVDPGWDAGKKEA